MPSTKLEDLFLMTLKDIYHGEMQILSALPKMVEKAESTELQNALKKHEAETNDQVERLKQVFSIMGQPVKGEECEAIKGLIAEGDEVMSEVDEPAVRDAGIIAAGQAIEHYEIARYGTLAAWARQLEMSEAADLLEETLDEEKQADETLNDLALTAINSEAA